MVGAVPANRQNVFELFGLLDHLVEPDVFQPGELRHVGRQGALAAVGMVGPPIGAAGFLDQGDGFVVFLAGLGAGFGVRGRGLLRGVELAEHAAKDLGILNMANSGGQMLGPVITSIVVTVTGGYQGAFITASVLIIAAAITLTFIRKVR